MSRKHNYWVFYCFNAPATPLMFGSRVFRVGSGEWLMHEADIQLLHDAVAELDNRVRASHRIVSITPVLATTTTPA